MPSPAIFVVFLIDDAASAVRVHTSLEWEDFYVRRDSCQW
jgi:hypothetical protein